MSRQHLLQLTRKHQDLDAKILIETKSPSSDDLAVRALKRQKLRLKEQIAQGAQLILTTGGTGFSGPKI